MFAFIRFSVYNGNISMGVSKLLDYISVKEAAEKWGISERRVQKLCEGNRIEGIVRSGHAWMIRIRKQDRGDISCIIHS